jgi:hypothetical protein
VPSCNLVLQPTSTLGTTSWLASLLHTSLSSFFFVIIIIVVVILILHANHAPADSLAAPQL